MSDHALLQRVALLDKILIGHPAWERAFSGIQACVQKSLAYREPIGSLLLAQGGMGKTTVCQALLKAMPPCTQVEGRFEKSIIPAFYSQIPSPATVKSVAASMLAQLHDPSPLSGTTAHMTARLVRLLAACETQLVFLDELHHLFQVQKTRTRVNDHVCNWIKTLVNQTGVTFCLVGLPQFAPILTSDSQLARRFPLSFELSPLRLGDAKSPGALPGFLKELMAQIRGRLDLRATPAFDQRHHAMQMYAATGGSPAFVMSVVKEATLHALKVGSDRLSLEDFEQAWESGLCLQASLVRKNPFRITQTELASSLREAV